MTGVLFGEALTQENVSEMGTTVITNNFCPQTIRIGNPLYGTFDFIIKTPPASHLIKEAIKLKSGSKEPGRTIAGTISKDQLKKIAEIKMKDLNAYDVEDEYSGEWVIEDIEEL